MNNQQQVASDSGFQLTALQRHSILTVCFFLYMLNFMDRQVLSAVLEPMKHDLGLTDTQAGMLQSFFFLSMAVLTFPAAYLVDRWSRRKTLSLMAIIWSVFTYVTGLGKSFTGVILPRIIVGVGEAGFPSAATAMISAAYPQRARSRVFGIFNAAIPLGAALGTILGGALAGRYNNWRVPFYLFALPGIIFAVLAFFLKDYKTVIEVDESGQKKKFLANLGFLFKIPTIRWVAIGYAMQMAMTMAFIAWGPAFLMRAQGLSVAKAGAVMGGFGLMGLIGAPLGGILADLWQKKNPRGRIYTPLAAAFASAVFLFLTIYFEFSGPGFVFGLLMGVTMVMGIPAVNSISQDVVTPGLKGISWAMVGFIAMLAGAAWAPSAVGAISDFLGGGASGLKFALMLMAVCGIMAGILFTFAAKPYPADMDKVKGILLEAE